MIRLGRELLVVGLGILFVANSAYFPSLPDVVTLGFKNSPLLTRVGAMYLGTGLALVALRTVGLEPTFRLLSACLLGGFVTFWTFLATSGQGPFAAMGYLRDVLALTPRVLPAALLLPLGVADDRRQRVVAVGAIAGSFCWPILWILFSPLHHGFDGPVYAVGLSFVFALASLALGTPLYVVGSWYRRENGRTETFEDSGFVAGR